MSDENRIDDEIGRELRGALSGMRLPPAAKRTVRARVRNEAGPFGWRERAAVGLAAAGLAAIMLNVGLLFAVPHDEPDQIVVVEAGMPAAAVIYQMERRHREASR